MEISKIHLGGKLQETQINRTSDFLDFLKKNGLVKFSGDGEVSFTDKGRIVKQIGVRGYFQLKEAKKSLLKPSMEMKLESTNLFFIFSGMFISLLLIIGFWVLQLEFV